MQLKSKSAALAAAVLCGALLTTSVSASTEADQQFSALQGVEAQALSAAEMDSIQGAALTVADIRAALARATAFNTRLQTAVLARFDAVTAPRIQALLDKLAALKN